MTNSEEMILVESKNRFQERGAILQFNARNMHEAIRNYSKSCMLCTMRERCTGKECVIQKAFNYNEDRYHEQIMRDPDLQADIMDVLIMDC